jgi:hypothetical protein
VLAVGKGARLAGQAAAIEGGVKGLRAEPIDVLLPTERRWNVPRPRFAPDMPEVRIHRTAILPARHRQTGRPPRTTVARAVIDAAAWAPSDEEAGSLIAGACRQRRVTGAELRNVLDLFPSIRRHPLMITTITEVEGGARPGPRSTCSGCANDSGCPRRICRATGSTRPDSALPRLARALGAGSRRRPDPLSFDRRRPAPCR